MTNTYDLIVIGAGPGGYEAAIEGAKKGMSVALIEKDKLGGTCLNRGCIPTKTILHSAELYKEMLNGEGIGLFAKELSFDMKKVQERKKEVITQLEAGIESLMKKHKITVYKGIGKIEEPHMVTVQGIEKVVLDAKFILIATGSKPFVPPISGANLKGVLTSDELLEQTEVCRHLVIIGGGVIGMEFASLYSALGCKVTVIEALERILSNMDKEVAQNLKMILKKQGVEIHTSAKVEEIAEGENGKLICKFAHKESVHEIEAEGVLMSVGRKAIIDEICGEKVELVKEKGNLKVNSHFQTSYNHIYAIGDVIGGIQLAHVATAEGITAVRHMRGEAANINLSIIPSCVYTNPEIGVVGISLEEAKLAEIKVSSKKYIISSNGKSLLSGQERGFIKIVIEEETEKILGATMMCARATDIISEFAVAIVKGLTVTDMAEVIRPHPTFCEGISEVVRE